MEECNPEMMREHERRITETEQSAGSAHHRINSLVELIKDFTVEMRSSNKNIADLVTGVAALTKEVSYVAKATDRHEEDIASIKDNMETKDTVLKLYDRIEHSNEEHKKGQDALMNLFRTHKEEFEQHKKEPAEQAFANQKALIKWLLVGFGSVLLSIVTTAVALFIFK